MNAARIKIIPSKQPSELGSSIDGFSINSEMGGAMALLHFGATAHSVVGTVEIRCTHAWALSLAEGIQKRIKELQEHCKKENIIPVESNL